STALDADPFPDFAWSFITGRDGAAALRFVTRIEAAWKRDFGRRGALLGTWGGAVLPLFRIGSATKALRISALADLVPAAAAPEQARAAARKALAAMGGRDVLFLFSHGYPDRFEGAFSGKDVTAWLRSDGGADLSPAVLFNCACWNGAPG